MLAGAASFGCDKNGSDDKAPSAAESEATPAGAAEAPATSEPAPADKDAQPGASAGDQQAGGDQAAVQAQLDDTCPMLDKTVDVQTSDTPDGVALTFTTTNPDDVTQLQTRVEHMATMYETHAGQGSMMWHQHGHMRDEGGHHMGAQAGMGEPLPAAMTKYEAIEGGARVVFTPRDPKELDALRRHVSEHKRRMSAGECWTPPTPSTGA